MKTKKSKSLRFIQIVTVFCALFLSATAARAVSGTWTNDFDSFWSEPTNWLDGIIANGSGDTASFNNALGSTVTVALDSSRSIGRLEFPFGVFSISNTAAGNTLTLDGPSKPTIVVPGGSGATLRGVSVSGTNGFILDGGGQLNIFKSTLLQLDPSNTISGSVVLSNGLMVIQGDDVVGSGDPTANNAALGNITSFTFYNNSTLNLRSDASTSPGYGVLNANLIVPNGEVGNLVLPTRVSNDAGDGGGAGSGIGGTLTGSGTLNVDPKYIRGNIPGDWSAFSGQINVAASTATSGGDDLRLGNTNGLPNASVDLGGLVGYTMRYYPGQTNLIYRIGNLSGGNAATFVAGSMTAGQTLFWDVGSKQTDPNGITIYAGAFVNGTGPAGVIWRGAGTWILSGNSTHTGPTVISNGIVQVGDGISESGTLGTGAITNMTALVISRGGTIEFPNLIVGGGRLTNSGPGTITLSGANTYSGPTVITQGKLEVGTASAATGTYSVGDNAALGFKVTAPNDPVTVTGIGLNASLGATNALDFNFAQFPNPTVTLVTNTGNVNLADNVTVNISGTAIGVGSVTLMQYNSRSGAGSFVPGSVPANVTGFTLTDDTVNKKLILNLTSVFDATRRYVGDGAGVWDIGNTANSIWRVIGSGQITNYNDGDAVKFDDTATGVTSIDLSTTVSPTVLTIDNTNKNYTFGGAGTLAGGTTLRKEGPGKLTMNIGDAHTGGFLINGGSVDIGDGVSSATIGAGNITNNATLRFNSAAANTVAGVISGTGTVVQDGVGILSLSGNNTHAATIVRSNATLVNLNGNAVGGAGSTLVLDHGILQFNADVFSGKQVVIATDSAMTTISATARRMDSPVAGTNVTLSITNSGLLTFNENLHGLSGRIKLASQVGGANSLIRFNAGGTLLASGSRNATWEFLPADGLTNLMTCRIDGVIELGALVGGPGRFDQQGAANGNNISIYQVGNLNSNSTFTGYFVDAGRTLGFTKVGTGTQTMDNVVWLNHGTLTVSNGTLAFTGLTVNSSSNDVIAIASPGILNVSGAADPNVRIGTGTAVQTLRGDGTITGGLIMGANGRLAPGFSIGNLTVSGNATLAGVTTMELTTTGSPASDRLTAANIAYGGTLVITNIGSITGSNVFQLFSGALSGSFTTVTTTIPGATVDTSKLNVNGTVTVVGNAVNTTPTNITVSVGGGSMTLSWPADHIGWRLQSQTNTLAVGLRMPTNLWFDVAGSSTTNQVLMPMAATNGTVFFRMVYP